MAELTVLSTFVESTTGATKIRKPNGTTIPVGVPSGVHPIDIGSLGGPSGWAARVSAVSPLQMADTLVVCATNTSEVAQTEGGWVIVLPTPAMRGGDAYLIVLEASEAVARIIFAVGALSVDPPEHEHGLVSLGSDPSVYRMFCIVHADGVFPFSAL